MINLKNKKYLVFDFDGTLDDLIIDWSGSSKGWVELAEKLTGKKQKIIGNSYVFQGEIIKQVGKRAATAFQEFTRTYEMANYSGHEPKMMLINFIEKNQDKYQFFLWTSNHSEVVLPVLKELGLVGLFKVIVSRDSVALPKPDPEGFSQIFIPQTDKTDYLMIGDSDNDRLSAGAAGIDFIDVLDFIKLINQ